MTNRTFGVDRMQPGWRFSPHAFELTEEQVASYRTLFGSRGEPLGLLSVHARLAYATDGPPPEGGVMAGMTIRTHAPLVVGRGYVFRSRVSDRTERKGNAWVTFSGEVLHLDDRHVATVDITGVWPL